MEGEFTAAIRSITAATEDVRHDNDSAEQIAMEREALAEKERRAKLDKPYSNDRR